MISRNPWLLGACGAGLVHAGFSLYWGLGGRWLLDTVGEWALDWAREAPVLATVVLLVVALVKVGGAVVPLVLESGALPGRAAWLAACWSGAVVLVCYGLANTVGAWLVLSDVVRPDSPVDRAALVGHAVLWDPLFLLWGLLLAAGLWTGRRRGVSRRSS